MEKACLLLNHVSLKVIYITTALSMRISQMVLPRSKRDLGNVVLGLTATSQRQFLTVGENHRSLADIWVLLLQPPFSFAAFFFFLFCFLCDLKKNFPFFPLLFVIYMMHYSYFSGFPYSFNIYT